jgi:hypothetical protein
VLCTERIDICKRERACRQQHKRERKQRNEEQAKIADARDTLAQPPIEIDFHHAFPESEIAPRSRLRISKRSAQTVCWILQPSGDAIHYLAVGVLIAVNHEGSAYNRSQVRQPKPVRQLIQVIRSPARKNTTSIKSIP